MEPAKLDMHKKTNMGGDQPSSFNMDEITADSKTDEALKEREKRLLSYQISPIASRSDRAVVPGLDERGARGRSSSGQRPRERRDSNKNDIEALPNRALLQAGMCSTRWPPHVVWWWALALLATHALHAAHAVLAAAAPPLKKLSTHLRAWTEEAWLDRQNTRLYPICLAVATVLIYTLYLATYALYSIVAWSIEPLYPDSEVAAADDVIVTDYEDLELKNEKTKQ